MHSKILPYMHVCTSINRLYDSGGIKNECKSEASVSPTASHRGLRVIIVALCINFDIVMDAYTVQGAGETFKRWCYGSTDSGVLLGGKVL